MASERRWVSVPDMPRAVFGAVAVALEGKLLVMGGEEGDSHMHRAVAEYDPGRRSWKELPGMLQARTCSTVTVLGGDVVVMGGQIPSGDDIQDTKLVERYNRRSQCWEAMPSLPCPLVRAAAIVVRV